MSNVRSNLGHQPWLRSSSAVLFITGLALLGGCDSTRPQVIAKLSCDGVGGSTSECLLSLPQGGGFTVTLEKVDCNARANQVRVTLPVEFAQVLTEDGCYETAPRVWTVGGSLEPGAQMAIEVESALLRNESELRVSGDYPEWVIEFEDGGDNDFNDMVFRVRANPPA